MEFKGKKCLEEPSGNAGIKRLRPTSERSGGYGEGEG